MATFVLLRFRTPREGNAPAAVLLRELTGRDERAVSSTSTADAIRLLDALLIDERHPEDERTSSPPQKKLPRIASKRSKLPIGASERDGPIVAENLTASDRDRLLAAIYQEAFGDRIENTLTCAECGQQFDIDFSLRRLTESLFEGNSNGFHALKDGTLELQDGTRFRLPTGVDELAVTGLTSEDAQSLLFDRCVGKSTILEPAEFESVLDEIAPIIHLDIAATCPECGREHTVEFDIQSYLLGAILGERRQLLTGVHRLASTYQWTLDEILSLARSERIRFAELIENEGRSAPNGRSLTQ